MFDIGWGELVVIGVVALIAIGPKELPGVLRTTGMWMGKIRRMASEFQDQFREAMREAEVDELKKKFEDDISGTTQKLTDFDPIGTVRKEFESLSQDPLAEKQASSAPDMPPQNTAETIPPATEQQHDESAQPSPERKAGEGV